MHRQTDLHVFLANKKMQKHNLILECIGEKEICFYGGKKRVRKTDMRSCRQTDGHRPTVAAITISGDVTEE